MKNYISKIQMYNYEAAVYSYIRYMNDNIKNIDEELEKLKKENTNIYEFKKNVYDINYYNILKRANLKINFYLSVLYSIKSRLESIGNNLKKNENIQEINRLIEFYEKDIKSIEENPNDFFANIKYINYKKYIKDQSSKNKLKKLLHKRRKYEKLLMDTIIYLNNISYSYNLDEYISGKHPDFNILRKKRKK